MRDGMDIIHFDPTLYDGEYPIVRGFQECFERNYFAFYDGVLYRCPRSAHGESCTQYPKKKRTEFDFAEEDTGIDSFR